MALLSEELSVVERKKRLRHWYESGGPFPLECRGLTCEARTRAGTLCKQRNLFKSGRCRFHGGLSTGPTSEKGKRSSAKNGYKAGSD
ncbi:HGGxSTG domain-containing protein [uncultured Zhongshania sp.]|uniref:HGGxSTG domain-containing protein n=1 Tax=uncultured Zhongshania sp. TaxID=1642288 RepID=UPI003458C339